MKKLGILNSEIAGVLAKMGHTDTIVIADCGLPIPDHVHRIDLAIRLGKPTFLEVAEAIRDDMVIEKITLASEIKQYNPDLLREVERLFAPEAKEFVPHEQFKALMQRAKAVIRTGENSPYANVILHAGVIF
ncbi:D-ribose pyranase [Polycladomyces subterraneus]|uniref:D-ribose pyranase n=1 Tax=Polycladomyces subterraneus TaxID=1016997 RepID=A0ABT8IMK2_9BACL|nr:D-ribose pyranase [Polycladomyces subterraneus]MDN4593982.1 D-ribose pyranase [Polycladomyces subterraneus]